MNRNRMLLLLVIALAAWFGIAALTAQAAPNILFQYTITVNTTVDEYNAGADCSLREAIKTANDDADFGGCVRVLGGPGSVDRILLPAGTYLLTRNGPSE